MDHSVDYGIPKSETISAGKLYEEAYKLSIDWEQILPNKMFLYHDLLWKETNAPISLQMGNLLPFISTLCGPTTKSLFLTRPSVINLFWINIAASGSGKTQSRSRLVSESIEYILKQSHIDIEDFEVSKYTRAGIEDKLISTKGYLSVITDEGNQFFDDLSRKLSKHETDLSLLNQLYDGKGDKTTLAQNRERKVPCNSSCLSISIQQEGFIRGLENLGKTLWSDSGFGERFIVTAIKPFRFNLGQNKAAAKDLMTKFGNDFMSKICLGIFEYHHDANIVYELDDKASEVYEQIYNRINQQYNRRYGDVDLQDQPSSSQPILDDDEKLQIPVRTKAPELLGRLCTVLWVYFNAFKCIEVAEDITIPIKITAQFVRMADEILDKSYSQSETFSSSVLAPKVTSGSLSYPKPINTSRQKVVNAIIRSIGPCINIRNMTKKIRLMSTDGVTAELLKLASEGYGRVISRQKMVKDKCLPDASQCQSVYMKPEPTFLDKKFYDMASDKNLDSDVYYQNFQTQMTSTVKRMVIKYHPHKDFIEMTQGGTPAATVTKHVDDKLKKLKIIKPQSRRTALDDLLDGQKTSNVNNDLASTDGNDDYDSLSEIEDGKPKLMNPRMKQVMDELKQSSSDNDSNSNVGGETSEKYPVLKLNKVTNYPKSKKGNKLIPLGRGNNQATDSESLFDSMDDFTSDNNLNGRNKQVSASQSANEIKQSEELESKSGNISATVCVHSHPRKTIRWNRPKRVHTTDVIPIRKSQRIRDIQKKKNKDSSSSEQTIPPTDGRKKRRRLSRTERNTKRSKRQ